jgi:predicted anti-sigma-YlaC factor YlaD
MKSEAGQTLMADAHLDCNELVELVTEYLEGAMDASERARLEAHLAICRGCRAYLDQMRRTIQAVGHLPPEAVTPDAQQDLLTVFRAWKAGAEPRSSDL